MRSYSDAELERMLLELKSDLVERKESLSGEAPARVREAICAFANDLPGHGRPGVLFVGAKDDGTPAGPAITDELLRKLSDAKTDGNIVPPPTMTVAKHLLKGSEFAVATVWPSNSPPMKYKGRIWIRVGPRRAIASAQDESILNERRRHRDRPFDVQPVPSASIGDLSRAVFESEYLPAAVAPDVLEANDRTYEERLAALKMISSAEDPTPTVLGVLVLSPRTRDFLPGAYVQFLRIDGRGLADPIRDEAVIDGSLGSVLRRIDEKIGAHIQTAIDIVSGDVERRSPDYPRVALQQIVRNAVMHRTYEATHAPIRVTWFNDRVEILSPGGPFGTVRSDNFGRPGVTDYRNPNLAEAMRILGFVQRFGVGIALAQRSLGENGNPPLEFDVQPALVGATLRSAR